MRQGMNRLWVYASAIFLIALVILIFTAYSQMKFNKQIVDYKSQLLNNETEKSEYEFNLNTALDENIKLKDGLEKAINELSGSKAENERLISNNNSLISEYENRISAYENLAKAYRFYADGKLPECANILRIIKESAIGTEGAKTFTFLWEISSPVAARSLYNQGLELYRKSRYTEAVDKLTDSNYFSMKEYFSDDCLYFLAYSEYKRGNIDMAIRHFSMLIDTFPSSNCYKDSQYMIGILEVAADKIKETPDRQASP